MQLVENLNCVKVASPLDSSHPASQQHHARPCLRTAAYQRLCPASRCARHEHVLRFHNAVPKRHQGSRQTPEAWQLVTATTGVAMLLCNLQRSAFTMVIPMLPSLTPAQVGFLQSSMLAGYLIGQLPAGALSDRLGGERVLIACLFMWSLALMATSAATSLPALVAARAAFGVLSACIMPAVSSMAARWVPSPVKASTIAGVYLFFNLGGVLGLVSTPQIAAKSGWQATLITTGAGGVMWALMASLLLRQATALAHAKGIVPQTGRINAGMLSSTTLAATSAPPGSTASLSRWQAAMPQVLALCWVHGVIGWGFFVLQSWLPMYLRSLESSVTLTLSGVLASLPWLAAGVMGSVWGGVADGLIQSKTPRLRVRQIMHAVSALGCALCVAPLAAGSGQVTPAMATLWLTAFNACYAASFAGLHAYIQDVAASDAGLITGLTNSCSIVLGALGTFLTGLMVQASGSFTTPFLVTGLLYISSFCVFLWQLQLEPLQLSASSP